MCQICGMSGLTYSASTGTSGLLGAEGSSYEMPQYGGSGANFRTTQAATGDVNINGLISGNKWGGSTLTYSFPVSTAQYESNYGAELTAFSAAGEGLKTATRYAFNLLSQYTNLTTTEVNPATTMADIRTANYSNSVTNPTAYAFYPSNGTKGGDVWYGTEYAEYQNPLKGQYAWTTVIHELGHALGLKHGHEVDGVANTAMQTAFDQMAYSVMTYRAYQGAPTTGYTNEQDGFATTFMMYDIAALQTMYGANFNTNSGNTTYRWDPNTGEMFIDNVGQGAPSGNRIFMTLWDGNGTDTYDFSNYGTNLSINLTPGAFSITSAVQTANLGNGNTAPGNIFNALQFNGDARSLIENATGGTGNDTIVGNDANNILTGGAGNDTLDGGAGNDTILGGSGADSMRGNTGSDSFVFYGSQGNAVGSTFDSILDYNAAQGDVIELHGGSLGSIALVSPTANLNAWLALSSGSLSVTLTSAGPLQVRWFATESATTLADGAVVRFDMGNQQFWSQYTERFDNLGNFDYQSGFYDTGNSWVHDVDQNNQQAHTWYRNELNSSGAVFQQIGQMDDGRTWDSVFTNGVTTKQSWADSANNQFWSRYDDYFTTSGAQDYQTGFYDNGNGWLHDLDQDNSKYYSYFRNEFDSSYTLFRQTGLCDDGRSWNTTYSGNTQTQTAWSDTANAYSWSTILDVYGSFGSGLTVHRTGTYDNGSTFDYYF